MIDCAIHGLRSGFRVCSLPHVPEVGSLITEIEVKYVPTGEACISSDLLSYRVVKVVFSVTSRVYIMFVVANADQAIDMAGDVSTPPVPRESLGKVSVRNELRSSVNEAQKRK